MTLNMMSIEERKKLGQKLKQLRLDAGETQTQTADAIGVTVGAVSLYEAGERVPADPVKSAISRHFNVPIDIFFCLIGIRNVYTEALNDKNLKIQT